eukprot:355508-Chlamydomonas_euryale.AAC.1
MHTHKQGILASPAPGWPPCPPGVATGRPTGSRRRPKRKGPTPSSSVWTEKQGGNQQMRYPKRVGPEQRTQNRAGLRRGGGKVDSTTKAEAGGSAHHTLWKWRALASPTKKWRLHVGAGPDRTQWAEGLSVGERLWAGCWDRQHPVGRGAVCGRAPLGRGLRQAAPSGQRGCVWASAAGQGAKASSTQWAEGGEGLCVGECRWPAAPCVGISTSTSRGGPDCAAAAPHSACRAAGGRACARVLRAPPATAQPTPARGRRDRVQRMVSCKVL